MPSPSARRTPPWVPPTLCRVAALACGTGRAVRAGVPTHLTVRASRLAVPLTHPEVAPWLWARLEETFPDALAAVLMPNHPHIVLASEDPAESRVRLGHVLSGLRRSDNRGAAIAWAPIAEPDVLSDHGKASRMIRYVLLNPCRAGLAGDPLCWPWSTHRDIVGAIARPWVDDARLAGALGRHSEGFAAAFHRYVSSDPTVAVAGTPFPEPAPATRVAAQPLDALIAAAASATRGTPQDIRRRGATRSLFLQLAVDQGWRNTSQLASLCGISPRAVQKCLARPPHGALGAARLCLGDPRLRAWRVGDLCSPNANFEARPPEGRPPKFAFGELP